MRSIFLLFLRSGGFVTLILVEAFCFYLIVRFNDGQAKVWANTSAVFGGWVFEQRRKATQYFDLERTVDSLQWENAALRTELYKRQLMQVTKMDTVYDVHIDSIQGKISRPEYAVIPAFVIGNTIGGTSNWITLNRGSKDGISVNSGVLSREGLVGIVRYTDENFSLVMSLLHRQTRVSAKLRNQLGSLSWTGEDPSTMTLYDIPKDIEPAIGDSVVTSGYSYMFPGNHLIGRVAAIDLPKGSNFYAIKVKLSHNMSASNDVFVVHNLFQAQIDSLQRKGGNE